MTPASFEPESVILEQFHEAQEGVIGARMPSPITSELERAIPVAETPPTFAGAQENTSSAENPSSSTVVPEFAEQNIDMPSTSKKLTRAGMLSTILSDFEQINEIASTLFSTQEGITGAFTISEQQHVAEKVSHQETLRENNNVAHSASRGYITSPTQSNRSDDSTVKFQGLEIRSNSLKTLQNVWSKHGNLIENCIIRNGDVVAKALVESLATAVLILEETSVRSLTDSQADYLNSTLSDLQCMHFRVDWLVPCVEKAVQLHKSKPLMDSLDQLLHCQAKVVERRSKLVEELDELDTLEKELKEDVASSASRLVPFSGTVDLDQPVGWGSS